MTDSNRADSRRKEVLMPSMMNPKRFAQSRVMKLRDAANRLRACRSRGNQFWVGPRIELDMAVDANQALTDAAEELDRRADVLLEVTNG